MKKLNILSVIAVVSLSSPLLASDLYQCRLNSYHKAIGGESATGYYDLYGQAPLLELGAGEITASIQYTSKNGQRGILGVMRAHKKIIASFLTYEPVREIAAMADLNLNDHYSLECVKQ